MPGTPSIRGAEFEVRALLTPQTTFSADLQYLDGTYNSFKYQTAASAGLPFTGCAAAKDVTNATLYDINCSGKSVANSPKWTLNAGIQHIVPVDKFNVILSADTNFRSSHYSNVDYIPQELVGATTNTDLQAALSPKSGPWTVAVFLRNLEGHRTLIYATHPYRGILSLANTHRPEPMVFDCPLSSRRTPILRVSCNRRPLVLLGSKLNGCWRAARMWKTT